MRAPRRRGALMAAVLVLLLVSSMLILAWAKSVATTHRQMRVQQWRVQADLLAESALERAAAMLRRDAAYNGETWQVPAADLGGTYSGEAIITVDAPEGEPNSRNVRVQAFFPADSDQRAQKVKQAVVSVN